MVHLPAPACPRFQATRGSPACCRKADKDDIRSRVSDGLQVRGAPARSAVHFAAACASPHAGSAPHLLFLACKRCKALHVPPLQEEDDYALGLLGVYRLAVRPPPVSLRDVLGALVLPTHTAGSSGTAGHVCSPWSLAQGLPAARITTAEAGAREAASTALALGRAGLRASPGAGAWLARHVHKLQAPKTKLPAAPSGALAGLHGTERSTGSILLLNVVCVCECVCCAGRGR